ncbi:MAG: hypothetical protein JWQ30_963, partial [Sediminibacterium sp.]|nr:hypothetical protein [Sediminibacterium sp.]
FLYDNVLVGGKLSSEVIRANSCNSW